MIVAIGVDVCDVARIRRALEGPTGARFRARVFTAAEQAYCEARGRARFASYAARFAAKEAAMKALGTGWSAGVSWQDFEVVRADGEPPHLLLHGRAAELARERRMVRWLVALSHERTGVGGAGVEGRNGGSGRGGGGWPSGRWGRRIRTATAQSPAMNPSSVQRFFGYPLLWAKSRHTIAWQMLRARAVPRSVGVSRSGATKRSPLKYPMAVARVIARRPPRVVGRLTLARTGLYSARARTGVRRGRPS